MLLTATAQLSVDGVMQAPGVNVVEDEREFDRRGWAHFDDEAGAAMDEIFGRASAFLFGRRTYELFASTWGSWPDPGGSRIWTALNTQPKHVASATLVSHAWPGTSVLSGDVAGAIRALTPTPGRELQVHGSGALFRWLLENNLVDEMNLFTFPVIVGRGTRLFAGSGPSAALRLVSSRSTTSGVLISVYRRAVGAD